MSFHFSDIWIQIQISVECKMHSPFSSEWCTTLFWIHCQCSVNQQHPHPQSPRPVFALAWVCVRCTQHTSSSRALSTSRLLWTELWNLLWLRICWLMVSASSPKGAVSMSLCNTQTHKPIQTCVHKHNQLIYSLLESRLILNAVTFLHMVKHGQNSKWKYKAGLVQLTFCFKNWVNYQRMW